MTTQNTAQAQDSTVNGVNVDKLMKVITSVEVSVDHLRLPDVMSSPRSCVGCSSLILVVSGHSNHHHASY